MSKGNNTHSEEKSQKWLTTFNDLVTLLLTFFVLTLSMSSLTEGKVKEAFYSISDAFGMLEGGSRSGIRVFMPFVQPIGRHVRNDCAEQAHLVGRILEVGGVDVGIEGGSLTVTLSEKMTFETGKAELFPGTESTISRLARILAGEKGMIRIEGHTDDVPVHNGRYRSNWDLSLARAVMVVKAFLETGLISPERLSAVGYGDSRPLLPNTTDANRVLNRRVEVVLTFEKSKRSG